MYAFRVPWGYAAPARERLERFHSGLDSDVEAVASKLLQAAQDTGASCKHDSSSSCCSRLPSHLAAMQPAWMSLCLIKRVPQAFRGELTIHLA